MLNSIGSIAGVIWHYLEDNDEATFTKLTREIGESERTVLMGVGWLAREGKLDFEKRKQGTYITLKTQQPIDFGKCAQSPRCSCRLSTILLKPLRCRPFFG